MVVTGSANNSSNNILAVARFNVDGTLDTSFGANGKVTTAVGTGLSEGKAILIQPDGKVVVAGSSYNGANDDFAVLRYNTNGAPDTSFGTDGIVTTPIGTGNDVANAIALQSDGKLVVAGNSYNGANNDFAVVRYNANGTLDTSFDGDGKVTTAIDMGEDQALAVKIQADDKIVVAGYGTIGTAIEMAVVRYRTNGALDTTFGSFGRVATAIGSGGVDAGFGLVIQTNSRIVVAGLTVNGGNVDVAIVRYNTNGTLDTSFDGDGKVTTPIGLGTDESLAMALQTDGKIFVVGASTIGAHLEFAAVRYNTDGSLDDSYGIGGKAIVDFGDNADNTGYALALDPIGRAVIAGDAGSLFGVARLQADPFLKILSITHLGNGDNFLTGVGVPGGSHTMNGSTTLNAGSFSALGPVAVDASGMWEYEDAALAGVSNRFYRLSLP
ncbi:MAG: hypothetical protein HY298_21460 [Verrucomicrobia bacterium]|nr:hypothetical protein [Verrucomicrobiota bacterium]